MSIGLTVAPAAASKLVFTTSPVTVTAGVASSNIPNALGFTVTIPAGFAARASEVNLNSDQLG